MPTITCTACSGRFARGFFANPTVSAVCRMCKQRRHLEEKLAEANNHISVLTRRIDSLEEFVSNNVARTAENTITTPQRRAPVAAPRRLSLPVSAASPPNNNNNDSSQEFQPVRNGARAATRRKAIPVTTFNKFQILTETEEDPSEVRVVGDSIIRGQLVEFCGRAPGNRKRFCIPGAGVNDVSDALDDVTNDISNNALIVVHAGTNDVVRTRSEELLQRYKVMIRRYRSKTNNVLISGVLPRIDADNVFYSKAFSLNNRLKSLCLQEGVEFINTWNDFYQQPVLFADDGLHLNAVGSARLGRLLNDAVRSFWRKNAQRSGEAGEQT